MLFLLSSSCCLLLFFFRWTASLWGLLLQIFLWSSRQFLMATLFLLLSLVGLFRIFNSCWTGRALRRVIVAWSGVDKTGSNRVLKASVSDNSWPRHDSGSAKHQSVVSGGMSIYPSLRLPTVVANVRCSFAFLLSRVHQRSVWLTFFDRARTLSARFPEITHITSSHIVRKALATLKAHRRYTGPAFCHESWVSSASAQMDRWC